MKQSKMFSLFSFLLLIFGSYAGAYPRQNPDNIFLLAGQSNMAGRGGVTNHTITHQLTWDGVVPPLCAPNPNILRLTGNLTWVEAQEPLHVDIDELKTNGVGPGMAFANALLANKSVNGGIGLVPCAIGGTNISQWEQGSFLYDQLVTRARAALLTGGRLRGLLWYQGESDTNFKDDAEAYGDNLNQFFLDIRSDLQAPNLPIIQVALASGEGPYVETVRRGQFHVSLANLRTVDAGGLPLEPDHLHLITPAQVVIGVKMANEFSQLGSKPQLAQAPDSSAAQRFPKIMELSTVPVVKILILVLVTLVFSKFE